MAGHGAPPEWYGVLEMAESWGMAPWVIEDEAPAIWVDRYMAVYNERNKPRTKAGTGKRVV